MCLHKRLKSRNILLCCISSQVMSNYFKSIQLKTWAMLSDNNRCCICRVEEHCCKVEWGSIWGQEGAIEWWFLSSYCCMSISLHTCVGCPCHRSIFFFKMTCNSAVRRIILSWLYCFINWQGLCVLSYSALIKLQLWQQPSHTQYTHFAPLICSIQLHW